MAYRGGADAVSLINTVASITGIDLDLMAPTPTIDGKGTHGGYCGRAVKPIALNMVSQILRNNNTRSLPISGIGGVTTWKRCSRVFSFRRWQCAGLHCSNGLWI